MGRGGVRWAKEVLGDINRCAVTEMPSAFTFHAAHGRDRYNAYVVCNSCTATDVAIAGEAVLLPTMYHSSRIERMIAAAHPEHAGAAAHADAGSPADVQRLLEAVIRLDANASDAVLIDRIATLERLKSSCAAVQARLTSTFADSIAADADAAARKHRPDAVRRSIAGQVALARRDSPHAGRRHVGWPPPW